MDALQERGPPTSTFGADLGKVQAVIAALHETDLGVGRALMARFRRGVSLIVHLAWPVNFSISLQSFEPHLAGLTNLSSLSTATAHRARFFFASSVSVAGHLRGRALSRKRPSWTSGGRLPSATRSPNWSENTSSPTPPPRETEHRAMCFASDKSSAMAATESGMTPSSSRT
ncbi:NAD(P)-binding domain protein [Moelleriella libera RCEF 2490]|uniref:NAD(P)-binding domain protein n=1 Tax=Moelleriella libera RCEF 2490 TaxID=1081109 RepID=A0A167ZNB5_9HYPO|nr:NAD(P)-binding domain protein [Moelleriella libera RCEF 2490]